jgi:hypothetical protein
MPSKSLAVVSYRQAINGRQVVNMKKMADRVRMLQLPQIGRKDENCQARAAPALLQGFASGVLGR